MEQIGENKILMVKEFSISVDVVLFRLKEEESQNYRKNTKKVLQVFLVKRSKEPYVDMWAIPGIYLQPNQNLSQCALECVDRKIGAKDFYIEQLYTFGNEQNDPRGMAISSSFLAITNKYNEKLKEQGAWFDLISTHTGDIYNYNFIGRETVLKASVKASKSPTTNSALQDAKVVNSQLAFNHSLIIHYALERLKNKVEYTNIGFWFLPPAFTLTAVQEVYQLILNKPLLTANFRRKIATQVVDAGQVKSGAGHRMPKLYKIKN
ncbi:MAG: hypothetical protein FWD32_01115 [Firmicutes bacterium]|nr:hypothetical protein [Bacillota bacterium]